MNPIRLVIALACFNLSLFVTIVAFLPRAKNFAWSTDSPLDYLIKSRTHWEIAWLVLCAGIFASVGVFVLAIRRPPDAE